MLVESVRQKWCPFVRFHAEGSNAVSNRDEGIDDGNPGTSRCIGAVCMAWRWNEHKTDDARTHHGYCGLAGKP